MEEDIQARYERAVASFVEKIKIDVNVLAVIVCGSLAYDKVWRKSDVDLLVLVRDQSITTHEYSIDEDDIIINAEIITRTQFQRSLNRANGGSFTASFYAKGKILYSTDPTIQEWIDEVKVIGGSDIDLCLMWLSCDLIAMLQKIEKWLLVKQDPMYAKLYLLKVAETAAAMEMAAHGEPPTREALMRAEVLNPDLIEAIYRKPMREDMEGEQVKKAMETLYTYLDKHLAAAITPVQQYLSDGEPRTATMIAHYFKAGSPHGLIKLLEYMREKGFLNKITQTIRITPKGRPVAEEITYIAL